MSIQQSIKQLAMVYDKSIPRADRVSLLTSLKNNDVVKSFFDHMFLPQRNTYVTAKVDQGMVDLRVNMNVASGWEESAYKDFMEVTESCVARRISGDIARTSVNAACANFGENTQLLVNIFNKSTPPGIGYGTIIKIWPDLTTPYEMQAARGDITGPKFQAAFEEDDVTAEIKYDGIRLWFVKRDGVCSVITRGLNNLYLDNFLHVFDELDNLLIYSGLEADNYVFDTEAEATDRRVTNGLCHRTYKWSPEEKESMKFKVFGIMQVEQLDQWIHHRINCTNTNAEVRTLLEELFSCAPESTWCVQLAESTRIKSIAEADELFSRLVADSREGLIAKIGSAQYTFGDSDTWAKMKFSDTADSEIVDILEGVGRCEGMMGAIVVNFKSKRAPDGKHANVGSGFSDEQRIDIWKRRHELIGKMCEHKHFGVTPDGSFDHGVFISIREDKRPS